MKPLTPTEQKIVELWPSMNRIEIAEALNKQPDTITTMARNIRMKGYDIKPKNVRNDDSEAILDSVKRVQRYYNQVGDSEAFKHEYRRIYQALGFQSVTKYSNRVKSWMGKNGVDGCYSDFIKGKVPGHRYIGTMPQVLLLQRWNGGLKL